MTTCFIGTTQPGDRFHAWTLLRGGDPERLIPVLRHLHAVQGSRLIPALLAHDRAPQGTGTAASGVPLSGGAPGGAPLEGRLTDPVPPAAIWLYLIDAATDTVCVYAATRHDRWLYHSRHHLDPDHAGPPRPAPPGDATGAGPTQAVTRQTDAPLTALRTSVSDRYVEEHTAGIRRGSVVLDPPYQRGSVWTTDQRVALMQSWLMGLPVAAITLNNRMGVAWYAADPQARVAYAVVDGRQRLETALAWEDGTLAIPASWLPADWIDTAEDTGDGPYVRSSGLTETGRRRVHSQMTLPCVIARLPDVAAEAGLYLLVNGAGTPQAATDLAHAARVARQ